MPTATDLRALRERLGAPVDGASLAALRIAFGVVMAVAIARFAAMGWIDELYVAPRFHLHYWGFEWVRPLPAPWIHVHFAAIGVAAAMIALGVFYRFATVAFLVLFGWAELLDAATYLNHYYAITLVAALLCALPAQRVASVDAWLAARRGRPLPPTVPRWALVAVRTQLGLVYFFAGVAKLQPDWLFHAEPLRTWLLARSDLPVLGPLFEETWVAYAMSWGGAVFDLSIPFLLVVPRTRPFAYGAVIVFHVLTGALFQIGMFPFVMIALTPIFFEPAWPRALLASITAPEEIAGPDLGSARAEAPAPALAVALVAWLGVQLVLPLRHHLAGENVLWDQAGMRWAWHVMVAERGAVLELTAVDDAGGTWSVEPSAYLTPLQATMAATEPDLLLQLAHLVRDDHAAHGRRVRVYADAWVALNGRPARRLVDPTVDLAGEEDRASGSFDWVLPLEE